MTDDAQWDRAEATLRHWRHQGRTWQEFTETLADQFSPLHQRFRTLIADKPVWGGWAVGHNDIWMRYVERLYALWQNGNIAPAAVGTAIIEATNNMGIGISVIPNASDDHPDKLKEKFDEQITERDQIIDAGTRQNLHQKRRIEGLESELATLRRRLADQGSGPRRRGARAVLNQRSIMR